MNDFTDAIKYKYTIHIDHFCKWLVIYCLVNFIIVLMS